MEGQEEQEEPGKEEADPSGQDGVAREDELDDQDEGQVEEEVIEDEVKVEVARPPSTPEPQSNGNGHHKKRLFKGIRKSK